MLPAHVLFEIELVGHRHALEEALGEGVGGASGRGLRRAQKATMKARASSAFCRSRTGLAFLRRKSSQRTAPLRPRRESSSGNGFGRAASATSRPGDDQRTPQWRRGGRAQCTLRAGSDSSASGMAP